MKVVVRMLYGLMISILFGLPNNKEMNYKNIKSFNRIYIYDVFIVTLFAYILKIFSNLENKNLFNIKIFILVILGSSLLPIVSTLFRMLLVSYEKTIYRKHAIIWLKKAYKICFITITFNILIHALV